MNTKSKIVLGISVACLVLSIAILAVVSIWASTRQTITSDINISYVAMEVRGSASARWKIGELGDWRYMTVNGAADGDTELRFEDDELTNAVLKPTQNTIKLSSENNFVVFEYIFTNDLDKSYVVDLINKSTSSSDSNFLIFSVSTDERIVSNFEQSINSTFTDWQVSTVQPNGTHYVYLLAHIQDVSKNANYDGSLSFTLDGQDYSEYFEFAGGTITAVNENLSTIRVPSKINDQSVTTIASNAFANATNLTELIIPDSVTSIGARALSNSLTKLKYIQIPFVGGVKTGGTSSNAFFAYIFGATSNSGQNSYVSTSLTNVVVSGGNIPDYAFYNCIRLTSITLLNDATSIGERAFYYCSGLTSITIPSTVTSIGDSAFRGCYGLTSITIPSKVTSIGEGAFFACNGLTSITIDSPDIYKALTSTSITTCGGILSYIGSGEKVYVLSSVVSSTTNTYINSTSWYSSKTTSGNYTVFTKK